jgi:hypothetical protein
MSVHGVVLLYDRRQKHRKAGPCGPQTVSVYRHYNQSRPMLLTQYRSILAKELSSSLALHLNSTIRPGGCLDFSYSQSNRFCINLF